MHFVNRGMSLKALGALDAAIHQLSTGTPQLAKQRALEMRDHLATFCRRQGLEPPVLDAPTRMGEQGSGLRVALKVTPSAQAAASRLGARLHRRSAVRTQRPGRPAVLEAPSSFSRWGGSALATVEAGFAGAATTKRAQATEREARAEKLDPARLSQDTAQSNLQAVTEAVRVVLDASPKLAWARVQAVYSDPETRAFIVHRAMHGISELEGLAGVVCGFQSLAEVDVFQLRRRTAMFQRLFAGLHAACEADVAAMGMGTIMAEISRQTRGRAAPTASAAAAAPAAS
ncbi:hypothetical protein FNF29_08379 [Cafeteria roenbergensis]|uniref:Uncharacterized protein n=1 Tax=Cafeteria roenbergensis TaxID=33653 RepID=A0A5A8BYQ0_CAFRO|nr:hypothetical protein FNF29_08379 [Cafeteria roenbergensis]|eukprot:KAA0145826.1 hypothetical protein FNF29_08379 [Cafeteria roenbergensis]